jgi:adhesin/invasin
VTIVNGIATTTFTGTAAGVTTIAATWTENQNTVTVTVTAGPPYTVTISTNTTSVQSDGSSYATITANVKDAATNAVANGTIVKFAVTPDVLGGGNGSIASQATTTNGRATVFLYTKDSANAKSKSGTATVTATVPAAGQPANVPSPATDIVSNSLQIQFISTDVGAITLDANPRNIRGWDIIGATSQIRASVKNVDGVAVPDGTVVHFATNHGLITASSTTSSGTATATLTSDGSGTGIAGWTGPVDITATAGTVNTQQVGLVIFSGWPFAANCTFGIAPSDIPHINGSTTITATLRDSNGNFVADGTTVSATTTKGTVTPSASSSGGNVTLTLSTSTDASNPTPLGAGTVTLTIPASGGSFTHTVDFNVN